MQLKKSTNSTPIEVVFLYKPFPRVWNYLKKKFKPYPEIKLIYPEGSNPKDLTSLVKKADILVGWNIEEQTLRSAQNLQLFISPYTGVEHLTRKLRQIDAPLDFKVVNAHGAAPLIAQHAVAMLLGITNHLVLHHQRLSNGIWVPGGEGVEEDAPSIFIDKNKTIGLLGYGQINQRVHQLLSGFPTQFAILRRNWENKPEPSATPAKTFIYNQLTKFLEETDFLIIAAPLTKLTKNMIGLDELKLLGKNGVIVNIGRADIINEKDFYYALKEKIIARAAIDVWYIYHPEPDIHSRHYPYSYPFHKLPNVLVSPHRADSPFDDLRRWDDIIENIKKLARGENQFLNEVDIQAGY